MPIIVKKRGNKKNKSDVNINVAEGDEIRVSESSPRSQSTAQRIEQAPIAPINSSGHIVRDNINVAEGDEVRVSESSAPINSSGHIVRDLPSLSLGELRKR